MAHKQCFEKAVCAFWRRLDGRSPEVTRLTAVIPLFSCDSR